MLLYTRERIAEALDMWETTGKGMLGRAVPDCSSVLPVGTTIQYKGKLYKVDEVIVAYSNLNSTPGIFAVVSDCYESVLV